MQSQHVSKSELPDFNPTYDAYTALRQDGRGGEMGPVACRGVNSDFHVVKSKTSLKLPDLSVFLKSASPEFLSYLFLSQTDLKSTTFSLLIAEHNMDQLKKKEHDVSRGLHYRYYVSPASKADTSKPTLVLLHGWPDSADLWQFVVPHLLKTKCRLVIPDLLGAGGTSKPTDPAQFQVKKMSNDIIEILKTEGISQNIIPMGHDW